MALEIDAFFNDSNLTVNATDNGVTVPVILDIVEMMIEDTIVHQYMMYSKAAFSTYSIGSSVVVNGVTYYFKKAPFDDGTGVYVSELSKDAIGSW